MTEPAPSYLTQLRQGIVSTFSAEEFTTLCSDLGVDYENLGGANKEAKARELIAHLLRRDQLALLAAYCANKRPRYPWPQDPAIAVQVPLASNTSNAAGVMPTETPGAATPMSAAARHLRQQLGELQGQYEALSKRIAALDKDLGRTLDGETKLVLKERRQELLAERDQFAADMARIEQQLAGTGEVAAAHTLATVTGNAPAGSLSSQDRASLEYQLAESYTSLRLIEERRAEFVQETDIPLTLIKNERRLRQRIAEIEARVGRT